ncbi:hypothetical protein D3Z51_12005 [Clostridiaceae bacterium]|nr:hypothetical protein [Clostridiaceae bacterium]RKI12612.1 hypothetical protein D7V81_11760 [bacterium 1XD21-70]
MFTEGEYRMLYDYLMENYGENTPIFVSELDIEGLNENTLRVQIKKMTDAGMLKRFDTGIYFIPQKTIFKSGSTISAMQVIEKKYLKNKDKVCGYLSGYMLVNMAGLTTQVPMVYEVVSNNATTDYRKIMISKTKVIVRRPKVSVTDENVRILQFLDLIRDVDVYSEEEGDDLKKRMLEIMQKMDITFSALEPYLSYYPKKIYKNMYETGVLAGVSA